MAKYKPVYDSIDELPETFTRDELFVKSDDGKFVFMGVSDCEHNNVRKLKEENGARRISEKKAKDELTALSEKFTPWTTLGEETPETIRAKLDRITELEESAKGKVPEEKLNQLADQRAQAAIKPLQVQLGLLAKERDSLAKTNAQYVAEKERNLILETVRAAAGPLGFQEATYAGSNGALALMALNTFKVQDGQVVAAGVGGFAEGLTPKEVLPEMLQQHPYLAKPSEGGGATGSGAGSGGRTANVFAQNNMGVRAALSRDNPTEYARQFKQSGMEHEFSLFVPRK